VEFELRVICVPDPPYVNVTEVTDSTITLSISPPLYTREMAITSYSVVYESDRTLSVGASDKAVTHVNISCLDSNTLYTIYVYASDVMGVSTASVISRKTHGN
jgi:hypothetical protein